MHSNSTLLENLNTAEISKELISCINKYDYLCLSRTQKWCCEMLSSFENVNLDDELLKLDLVELNGGTKDFIKYQLARSYFNLKEYARATFHLSECDSSAAYFLYVYSKYMAINKKSVENKTNIYSYMEATILDSLQSLRNELSSKHYKGQLDPFSLYVYGIVLSKLKLVDEAINIFIEALKKRPTLWCAWLELANLIRSLETLNSISGSLPQHWMKELFIAHCYMELSLSEEALNIYLAFCSRGFTRSLYIKSQMAKCYDNLREGQESKMTFEFIRKLDPYNLDFMDIYSNILFVMEEHAQLAILAQEACEIDKYRPESCCIIGNYYSLQNEHHKAVNYFQRALKLNPSYLQAWTLMGHEFMELKNSTLAVQSYTNAIELNPKDYRAWYGLGQTYEILKLYSYSLFYYKQAYLLRPNDSRFIVALADVYVKLEKWDEAKRCYIKAYRVGDYEGTSLCKLAKVYEKLNEPINVAIAYDQFTEDQKLQRRPNMCQAGELSQAYKYLANFYLKKMKLDNAYEAASKCLEFPETRQEAQTILNQIAQMRANSKEQDSAATAFLSAGSANVMDIMDIGHSSSATVNMSKLLNSNSANGAGKSSDNLNAPSTSSKQLSDELSSSMVLLDKLDAADHPTFGDNRSASSKSMGAQAGSTNANSAASNNSTDPVNIRISSDSDLESDNYFGEFNIKRFSNKRNDN